MHKALGEHIKVFMAVGVANYFFLQSISDGLCFCAPVCILIVSKSLAEV